MRTLKFRIWDEEKSKMLYLDTENITMEKFIKANNSGNLMISTGMKDKHGNIIFEGDYLNVYNTYKEEALKGKLIYVESRGEFVVESSSLTRHNTWINYELSVVGNMFENPNYLVLSEKESEG